VLDLVELVETLKAREIGLKVLTGTGASIDTTTADGRLFFGVLAVLAEFERELIRERTRAGTKAAKLRGRHVGRPRKLGPDQLDIAAQHGGQVATGRGEDARRGRVNAAGQDEGSRKGNAVTDKVWPWQA